MAITFISRDYGVNVSIVRVTTTDSLEVVEAPGYLTSQIANLVAINNGGFTWLASDTVLVNASDGFRLFGISSDLTSLTLLEGMFNATIALTTAQFKGMYATPVLLLPAAGANRLILVNKLSLAMTYGSAQYAAGGAVAAQYKNTANGAGVLATATIAAATINALAASTVLNAIGPASIVYADAVNQPLYLSNQTAAFTTGDSNFVVTVNYNIIATA